MAAKRAAKKEKAEEKSGKKRKIIDLVLEVFTENPGVGAQELIETVKKEFPKSKINKAHVAWYRGNMRERGIDVPRLRRGAPAKDKETEVPSEAKKKTKKRKRKVSKKAQN